MLRFLQKEIHFVAGCTGLVGVGFLTGCVAGVVGGGTPATVSPQVTPTPQIYSVSPGWITQNPTQPVTITVTGVNFTSDVSVLLDKSVGAAGEFQTTYVNPTQLTATLSTGILKLPQMFSVSVDVATASNSSVLYSNAVNFFVMSATPRTDPNLVASFSGTYGSPIPAGAQNWSFQMFGTNLSTNSTIEVNGSARTTYIGGDGVRIDEVTTQDFLPSEMAMPGSLQIVVISDPTIAPSAPVALPVVAQ